MFVNKESQLSGSGGIEVFDINRTRTENLIYPIVETGSVKNVFKNMSINQMLSHIVESTFTQAGSGT